MRAPAWSPVDRLLAGTVARVAVASVVLVVAPGVALVGRDGPAGAVVAVVYGVAVGLAARQLVDASDRDVPSDGRRRVRRTVRWFRGAPRSASVALAVLAGRALFEEAWWRGPVLMAQHRGVGAAWLTGVVLATSVGFALVHRVDRRAGATYVALGAACAFLCLVTGALLAAVVAHTTYNALWHASAERPGADRRVAP